MAKLRKWTAYRTLERPYCRFSKYRKKAFVKARPGKKVIKFDMGNLVSQERSFPLKIELISKDSAQVRTNSIEAARIAILKRLEAKLGRKGFFFRIKAHPHHVIRENPLAAGAGADRLSTGMSHSFGKVIGTASRVTKGLTVMEVYVAKEEEAFVREALRVGSSKLTIKTTIQASKKDVIELTEAELEKIKVREAEDQAVKAARKQADEDKAKEKAAAEAK